MYTREYESLALFTCGSIGEKFLSSLLEKKKIGGHRDRKTTQFNVIDHSEFKYKVISPPGGAIWEIGE